ncbi:AsmA family protein [Photobacterium angustum]|uniref:AsmA family protein n=1 Tax=Photobacterium angustum TaxID=661 RepID=UPI0005E8D043|nr:AsmA family protein [Photobacterium angustum]KJG32630.1 AsmA protein [Photobacterium angustum]PSW90105.1 AsmA family protein [Photobacterium angustum]
MTQSRIPAETASSSEKQDNAVQPPKKNKLKQVAKWTSIAILTPIIAATGVLAYGVKIDLADHRHDINQWLSSTLDRETTIGGDMSLTLSFSPEIELSDVTVANTEAMKWEPMLKSGYIGAKISVLPLLSHTLKIDYLDLKDISLHLSKDNQGKANWVFAEQATEKPKETTQSTPFKLALSNNIRAEKVSVDYLDQHTEQYANVYLDQLALTKPDKWLLQAKGNAIGNEYDVSLAGDLESLINEQQGKLDATGSFAGAKLNIDADIHPFHSSTPSKANVKLDWVDTAQLESLLDIDLRHAAPMSLTTQITASSKGISLADIALTSPITSAKGFLDISLAQNAKDLNHINGKLNIPLIDLRPWLQPQPPVMYGVGYAAAAPQKSPLQKALDQWLVKTETHLDLSVDEIKGLGTPVNNISLKVEGDKGKLHAPMTANIADVPFRGTADIDATQWTSTVDVKLGAQDSQLGEMAGWISGIPDAKGHLDKAQLQLTTQGTKLQEWIDNSQLSLNIDKAHIDWGAKASFAIDKAALTSGMEQPFSSDIQGQIMDIPVKITAKAGTLSDIINHRNWMPSLHFSSPVIDIKAQGEFVKTNWQKGSWLNLTVHSKDAGKLSPWLGTRASMHGKIDFKGKLTNTGDWLTLNIPTMALMQSQGKVDFKWKQNTKTPFLTLNAQFDTLNFNQLGQFVDREKVPTVEQTVPTQGVNLDMPLLSNKVVIADADVKLGINKMLWANQQIDDTQFSGQLRDGKLKPAPFSARYAGSLYQGDISLDINNNAIQSQLHLGVDKPNIGQILKQFNVTNDLGMTLDSAKLSLSLSGRTVLELMEQAKVEAQLNGGKLRVADTYTGKAFDVALRQGKFITGPDTATHLIISGQAANKPVNIEIDSVSLKQANDGRKSVPVTLTANVGDIALNAESDVSLPINPQKLNLTFKATTPNLDRFNAFTGLELPPYGPVTVAASLSTDKVGYHLRNMLVQVGSSKLQGKGDFLPPMKGQDRPTVSLDLRAPFIQINDFKVKNWQAWLPKDSKEKTTPAKTVDKPVPVLSPEGLNKLNANFKLNVGEVRSGKDWLGAGKLDWTLHNGLLSLNPLHIKLPGGNIDIKGSVKAQKELFDIHLNGLVKNFDYGIIARRIDPKTDMNGKISFEFNLNSLANTPDSLMNNANGFIGFAAWPKAFQANLIDLWAVSLADAVLPKFVTKDHSVLNCVAGGFNVKNGNMTQRDLLLDTSRIQVHGAFNASYKNRDFNLYLSPKSKKAQIFSLQTPVDVHGTFDKFNFNVPLSAILKTSVRFTTSPVVAPLQWLFEKPIAANGSAECERIWQQK